MNLFNNLRESSSFLIYADFKTSLLEKVNDSIAKLINIDKKNIFDYPDYFYYSDLKIEDVRNMISSASESSYISNKKFYVIDNVEKLKKEPLNAMLKILEEPPRNVYFLLLTRNLNILNTIKSRCIKINLNMKINNVKDIETFNFFDNDADIYEEYLNSEINLDDYTVNSNEEMINSIKNYFLIEELDLKNKIMYFKALKYLISNLKFSNDVEVMEIKDKIFNILVSKDNKISRDNMFKFFKTINNYIILNKNKITDIEKLLFLKMGINSNVNLKLIFFLYIKELSKI